METLRISDIQDAFTADVERFHNLTQSYVAELLTQTPPPTEYLEQALRQTQELKSLAVSVKAWGLFCLGADFEKLLELAGSWLQSDRNRANQVFQFILDHQQDWFVMNQFSCMDLLAEAWETYQSLRVMMEELWPGHLPPLTRGEGTGASEPPIPAGTASPVSDEQQACPSPARAKPPSPKLLRLVPPKLRHRKAAVVPNIRCSSAVKANRASGPTDSRRLMLSPRPVLLKVLQPALLYRQKAATVSSTEKRITKAPIIRVVLPPVKPRDRMRIELKNPAQSKSKPN